jgi:D-hydroxyproline dehydrogenase subunit beta
VRNDFADVVIVGAGIVGLAQAWMAAQHGRRVTVFERNALAQGATVRNFGMIWPIGQKLGKNYERAMRSREHWLKLRDETGVWVNECGSLHIATEADEEQVLLEFIDKAQPAGLHVEFLSREQLLQFDPLTVSPQTRGAMHSPVECCVEPRQAAKQLAEYLQRKHGAVFHWNTTVTEVQDGQLRTSTGDNYRFSECLVCSGADQRTLFPEEFAASGLRTCKLQMMATAPQPNGWRLGPHIAGGLTLLHYAAFADCPTLPKVRERFQRTHPAELADGIHVMASQNELGEVIIGDSHHYDAASTLPDSTDVDQRISNYLKTLVNLPDDSIARRWHGHYVKHPDRLQFIKQVHPGVHLIASPGGAGMTLSFALAEEWWQARRTG